MKKKLLSLMVIMSLVVSMTLGVTGCGSKSSDSDKKVLNGVQYLWDFRMDHMMQ